MFVCLFEYISSKRAFRNDVKHLFWFFCYLLTIIRFYPTPNYYSMVFSLSAPGSVVKVESRPKVLEPKEDEDGHHGEGDERSGDGPVGHGRGVHDEVLLPRARHDAAVDRLEVRIGQIQPHVVAETRKRKEGYFVFSSFGATLPLLVWSLLLHEYLSQLAIGVALFSYAVGGDSA